MPIIPRIHTCASVCHCIQSGALEHIVYWDLPKYSFGPIEEFGLAGDTRTFPAFRFTGTHRDIGQQFGEACRDLIHQHLTYALDRLFSRGGISRERAAADALQYRPFVLDYAPFFDEELTGLCEGANIQPWEAYLLQLRAELAVTSKQPGFVGDECTTFALLPEATATGHTLIGQNADLPSFYSAVGVVVEFQFPDMPSVLMLTPAGQLSYIGINDRGLGVCANFLSCDGWRYGFPRYLLSRLALTTDSVSAAVNLLRSVPRASSRNLLLCDTTTAIDMENTVTADALLSPVDGVLVHANHYVAPELLAEERSPESYLPNSRTRHARLQELIQAEHGTLTPERMQFLFQDRETPPNTLCRAPEDDPTSDTITFGSLIAEPESGQAWIAVGPPHLHPYARHAFQTAPREATPTTS
jgi:isopenicillin-N N-acyltransferase like protein